MSFIPNQRFELRVRHRDIELPHLVPHAALEHPLGPLQAGDVRLQSIAQVLRLADVEDVPVLIQPPVHARLGGSRADALAQDRQTGAVSGGEGRQGIIENEELRMENDGSSSRTREAAIILNFPFSIINSPLPSSVTPNRHVLRNRTVDQALEEIQQAAEELLCGRHGYDLTTAAKSCKRIS